MNHVIAMQRALQQAARRNPEATAEELAEAAADILMDWERDAAEERLERGIEDTPCIESCDTGSGEGRYHGLIG